MYNETDGNAILPTPTIGAIGIMENYKSRLDIKPKNKDILVLIGENSKSLCRAAFEEEVLKKNSGDAPHVCLEQEKKSGEFIMIANKMGFLSAVHDIAD